MTEDTNECETGNNSNSNVPQSDGEGTDDPPQLLGHYHLNQDHWSSPQQSLLHLDFHNAETNEHTCSLSNRESLQINTINEFNDAHLQ